MPRCLRLRGLIFIALMGGTAVAELPTASPESQGIDSTQLVELSQWIRTEGHDIRALVLLRNGQLVLEWYAGEVTREHHHSVFSITKTVAATLAGVALDQGAMSGLDLTLGEVFAEELPSEENPSKSALNLEQLLTMRSGLPIARNNQNSGPEKARFDRFQNAPDRLAWVLREIPMEVAPGSRFAYNNFEPTLVLGMIEAATGKPAFPFAQEHLFAPLGLGATGWMFADDAGQVPGGYGLRLRAMDLAKLGQLHLQSGTWEGRQVLSKEWVDAATTDRHGDGYGYYWWINEDGSYAAKGLRGQRLGVFPDSQLVYAMLSDLPISATAKITARIERALLNAATQDQPLPGNAAGQAELEAELRRAQDHRPVPFSSLPFNRRPQLD